MVGSTGARFLLFVAGEPDSGVDSLHDRNTSMLGRLLGMAMPFGGRVPVSRSTASSGNPSPESGAVLPSAEDERPWHFPRDQLLCVDMVLRVAEQEGRAVTVVDVNRARAQEQRLIDQYVGPNDVLPILVRPDGQRLEGVEKFIPQRVRKFMAHR